MSFNFTGLVTISMTETPRILTCHQTQDNSDFPTRVVVIKTSATEEVFERSATRTQRLVALRSVGAVMEGDTAAVALMDGKLTVVMSACLVPLDKSRLLLCFSLTTGKR